MGIWYIDEKTIIRQDYDINTGETWKRWEPTEHGLDEHEMARLNVNRKQFIRMLNKLEDDLRTTQNLFNDYESNRNIKKQQKTMITHMMINMEEKIDDIKEKFREAMIMSIGDLEMGDPENTKVRGIYVPEERKDGDELIDMYADELDELQKEKGDQE